MAGGTRKKNLLEEKGENALGSKVSGRAGVQMQPGKTGMKPKGEGE